jgi:carboxypeptidase family protein
MKRLFTLTTLIAALLCATALGDARAQGTSSIGGRIVDARNQQPIIGARVDLFADSLVPSSKILAATLTRKDGSFSLSGVAAGQYRLQVSKMGYALQELSGLLVQDNERTIVGEPIAIYPASDEYAEKMACNKLVRPDATGDVYVVCANR